jgi:hypothetical protein
MGGQHSYFGKPEFKIDFQINIFFFFNLKTIYIEPFYLLYSSFGLYSFSR